MDLHGCSAQDWRGAHGHQRWAGDSYRERIARVPETRSSLLLPACFCAWLPTCLTLPLPRLSTPVAQLLYQEYSDVALNKEIQSQQRLDSLAEAPGPASPRQPRRTLVSSESYLQRLSMASSSSLWQEIPVVRNSTVLLSMTHEDQKLQEVPRGAQRDGVQEGKPRLTLWSPVSCSPPLRAGGPHTHSPHTRACRKLSAVAS